MARTEVRLLSHLSLTLCVRLHSQGTHMPYRTERCRFVLLKGQHYFLTQHPGVNWNDSLQDAVMHLCTWRDYLFSILKQLINTGPSFNKYVSQFIKIWDNSQWVLLGPKVTATLGYDGGGATHHKLLQGKRLCYRQTTGHASGTAVVTWFHWASTNISKATWIFLLIFTVVK